jgi:hypothetical protein
MKKIFIVTLLTSLIALSCGKIAGLIPQKVSRNGVNIEYTGVSKEDANLLLTYLADQNSDGHVEDYKLSKDGDGYLVKAVVQYGVGNTSKDVESFTEFACDISMIYQNKQVTMQLCDDKWALKNTVKSGDCAKFERAGKKMELYKEIELYYGKDITLTQRDKVGEYAVDFFGGDDRVTTAVDKVNGKGVFSVCMDKRYYDDKATLDAYRIVACDMGVLLGVESEVHLCDDYMKVKKVVKAENCDK